MKKRIYGKWKEDISMFEGPVQAKELGSLKGGKKGEMEKEKLY